MHEVKFNINESCKLFIAEISVFWQKVPTYSNKNRTILYYKITKILLRMEGFTKTTI